MNKFKIILGAAALAMAAVVIVACSKEKTAQQEMSFEQQPKNPNDYTLAEMAEAMSWEEGKAFFENQPIKDYTYVCEKVLNDCAFTEKSSSVPTYVFGWHWATIEDDCISEYKGFVSVSNKIQILNNRMLWAILRTANSSLFQLLTKTDSLQMAIWW